MLRMNMFQSIELDIQDHTKNKYEGRHRLTCCLYIVILIIIS